MASVCALIIIYVCFFASLGFSMEYSGLPFTRIKNRRFDHVFDNILAPTAIFCCTSCSLNEKCFAVNYLPEVGRCELNEWIEGAQMSLNETTGVDVYYQAQHVKTCAMLQQCSPGKPDGEYWLEPEVLGTRVKLYCHNMASQSPQEYITLPGGNMLYYSGSNNNMIGHRERTIHFQKVAVDITVTNFMTFGKFMVETDGACPHQERTHNFQEVAVNLTDMTILSSDLTFSDYVSGDWSPYGRGGGCRGPIAGYFNIDTTGTGLILDPSLVWAAAGYDQYMNTFYRSPDGTQISANCGGMCGKCESTSAMNLQINTNEEVPASDAAWPTCG